MGSVTMDPAVLDNIICRLLEFKQGRTGGKQVQLMEGEIHQLCTVAREILIQQPTLLELEAPIKICGREVSDVEKGQLLKSSGWGRQDTYVNPQ
ncbi:hypothetical protein Goari_019948 [Gossypium aridum]|uniref:protein-serine/threonine phosphatase n=1 Tax=Gossypium aridum TaxID=34290 RepID=A0A7J8WU77_GOSAI|nr:hypothetical protein [Gossypium aridum]